MEDKSLSLKASDTRSTTKHRTVFLLIIPNRLFKAHWSLMVPYTEESPQSTRIRVTGDVLNGFRHEIERAYIVAEDDRHPKIIDLGKVSEGDVVVGWSKTGIDATPTNRFEELALGVRAPGPGMGAASVEGGEDGRRARADLKDCQSWIKEVVQVLVEQGVLNSTALEVVEIAPKH